MKKILIFAFIFLVPSLLTLSASVQDKQEKQEKKESAVFNTVCPVSGEEIDGEFTHTYNGKTYAVCCKRCLKKFEKDPEKFIKNLSEDGKKFKKGKN